MEQVYCPSYLSLTLISIPIFFFFLLKHSFRQTSQTKLLPGPWSIPIVGNLLQIAGSLPHHALTNLAKKHGPIIHLQHGEISTVVISSARLAREALTTHDIALANRPPFEATKIFFYDQTDIGFAPYGMYWRQMRKICSVELLSVSKVQSFHSVREEEVENFIESIRSSSGSQINLSKRISVLQNLITFRVPIGSGSYDQEELIAIFSDIISIVGGFAFVDLFPSYKLVLDLLGLTSKLQKKHQKLDRILDNIISEHRENDSARMGVSEDLLDVLLRLKESGSQEFDFDFNNIKAVIMDMFIAGTDTTSTTIKWAMAEMMRNTRVLEKAQAEVRQVIKGKKKICESDVQNISYLKIVVKETLRLHGPGALLLPRMCREQCEVGGYTIPVKTMFIVNAWAIARDLEYWDDPESFKPERFENTSFQFNGTSFEYIPFGAGRRICPGLSFGIANVELTLANLLYHFNWKLPNEMKPEDLDMNESFGVSVILKNDLVLVATPYSSAN